MNTGIHIPKTIWQLVSRRHGQGYTLSALAPRCTEPINTKMGHKLQRNIGSLQNLHDIRRMEHGIRVRMIAFRSPIENRALVDSKYICGPQIIYLMTVGIFR